MKLSTKIILPIILISALLILLNGCMGTVPDESPGYTPGTITGIIASPCCSTSDGPVSETSGSPEYWCYYCQETWSLQDGVEVILTYGEDEVATVFTNKDGEFTFTNVDPGKNYVVTAYCPDFEDNRPLVKDVALELIEGGSFDTKITDLVSTSLGLVVDFLVVYTEWGPEDISLDEVLADRPSFPNFPKFKKLVYEVRRVVENCEVNLLTDDDVQDALCRAAEEISKLEIGCGPGYTPPPPEPDPCDPNSAPVIDKVEYDDGTGFKEVDDGDTINVIVNQSYTIRVTATDDGIIDPLTYSGIVDGSPFGPTSSNQITVTPDKINLVGYLVSLSVYDGCDPTPWGSVTVIVECNEPPEITSQPIATVCVGDDYTYQVTAIDPETDPLTYSLTTKPDGMNISSTGLITWTPVSVGSYPVTVEVSDGCSSVTQEFTVTVDAGLTGAEFADTYAFTICSDETLDIGSLVTIIPEFGSVPGAPVTLAELIALGGYVVDASDGSFSFSGTEIIGSNSGSGSGTLTVTYVDPNHGDCGLAEFEIVATIGVTVEECFDYCFILNIKAGGETHVWAYETIEPDIVYPIVESDSNASKFQFMINCPQGTLEYNYYRGFNCGADWESGDQTTIAPDPSLPPPTWLTDDSLVNGVFFPANINQGLLSCEKGGNILKIRVNEDSDQIFTFTIDRGLPPTP